MCYRSIRKDRARHGWEVPGPLPAGEGDNPDLLPGPGESLDALCGHWRLFQLRQGHRWSTDDLLAAWYTCELVARTGITPGHLLELGSGLGTVSLLLAWQFPSLEARGIEIQPSSLALARRSARWNGVEGRVHFQAGDLRQLPGDLGAVLLLVGTPPYWDVRSGRLSLTSQKVACRFEEYSHVQDYMAAAAQLLLPGGLFVLVYDGRQKERLYQAARQHGLTRVGAREVISREGDPPLLVLSGWEKGGVEKEEDPPLILRLKNQNRSDEFRLIRAKMGLPPGT